VAVAADVGGQSLPGNELAGMSLTFGDGTFEFSLPGKGKFRKGTLQIDTASVPARLRGIVAEGGSDGREVLGICQVPNENTLFICWNLVGTFYPESFNSQGGRELFFGTYRRQSVQATTAATKFIATAQDGTAGEILSINLRFAQSSEVVNLIKRAMGGPTFAAVVGEVERTNSILVNASHPGAKLVIDFIRQMDVPPAPRDPLLPESGVGFFLAERDGGIYVTSISPGTPAAEDGRIKVGDRLISVSNPGKPRVRLEKVPMTEVLTLIRGEEGVGVTLGVIPAGKAGEADAFEVTLVRKRIFGTGADSGPRPTGDRQ
jgi:hypothetical protein